MSNEQENKGQRPNAKYALSNPDSAVKADEGLTFYYNRERRLEKAPEAVKNLYKNEPQKRFGLVHTLIADRPRRILFFIIIFMCLAILALSFFGYFDTSYTLDMNRIDITAAGYEDTTYVVLRKTAQNVNAYSGAVDIAVSVIAQSDEEQYPVYYHRIFFTLEREEVYRFAVPFVAPELLMVLQNEKNTLHIRFKPE
jgi:hypothetical protein